MRSNIYAKMIEWLRKSRTYTKRSLIRKLIQEGNNPYAALATATVLLSPRIQTTHYHYEFWGDEGDMVKIPSPIPVRGNISRPWNVWYNEKCGPDTFRFRIRKFNAKI